MSVMSKNFHLQDGKEVEYLRRVVLPGSMKDNIGEWTWDLHSPEVFSWWEKRDGVACWENELETRANSQRRSGKPQGKEKGCRREETERRRKENRHPVSSLSRPLGPSRLLEPAQGPSSSFLVQQTVGTESERTQPRFRRWKTKNI